MGKSVIISREHRVVVLPSDTPIGHWTAVLPDGRGIVPHDISTYQILRRLGFDCPNPVIMYYEWPGGRTPFQAQRVTASLLTAQRRAYVLNGYGTGKTFSSLCAWDALNKAGAAGKLLVVAPRSTLNQTWGREILSFFQHRTFRVLGNPSGQITAARRRKLLAEDADIYIINRDGVKTIHKELSARKDIDTLILDELAEYRNPNPRSRAMKRFAERFTWVWGMTGSPMPNEPTDVWMQCRILTPDQHGLPPFSTHARDALMLAISQYKFKPKPGAIERAYSWMQPSVRFTLDDITELPDLIIPDPITVEMSPEQKDAYKRLVAVMITMVREHKITAANAGVLMSKLLQVAGGWVYDTNKQVVALNPEPRLNALVDIIRSNERKVIVFSGYRHTADGIGEHLAKEKIPCGTVHGGTKKRDDVFTDFQYNEDGIKVLNAHPECMAHGLTLTAANVIVWYGLIPSLNFYDQANARIRRVGQTHKQIIHHFVTTPVEKKVLGMLRSKQKLQDHMLALVEEATKGAT